MNMFDFIKQIPGRLYTPINSNDAKNIAFVRQLQREMKKQQILEVPFSELEVVVFDLETTGFFPEKGDKILSIGAIKMRGEEVLEQETFYSLVHNSKAPSEEIEALTGITIDELLIAPKIDEVLQHFFEFVKTAPLIAHHANHEKSFMQHVTWKVLKSRFEHRIIDTSFLTKIILPNENLVTLDHFCSYYGITIEKRHDALHDAIATAKLWGANVKAIQSLGFQHLKDVYGHLAKR